MLPFETIIQLDKGLKLPIYKQIAFSIITAIQDGVLRSGMHLPGSRELAKMLHVHRKTVIAAYDELQSQDWIVVVPRKYVSVSDRIPILKPQKWNGQASLNSYENDFPHPIKNVQKNVEICNDKRIPDLVIDDGRPDVRLSPIDQLLKIYRSNTSRNQSIRNAHVGTDQGTLRLRESLANYLYETRGIQISVSNLLITHGAQMSIYLASKLILNSGSNIIVAKPNYPVANSTFKEVNATVLEVSVDDDGIDTDAIEDLCMQKKITAVYVIPHHHYPTTVTLSVERRIKLLELSKQYSFTIIEDDYDYDYHYASSPYLPLACSNHNGSVIYIGSFSKMLDPSLRIGFMVAPSNFIAQAVSLRKLIDVGGDGYMQNALATLIEDGELKRHLKKAKKTYHQRRDFLDVLLKEKLSDYISYRLPSGGMTIWIKLLPQYSICNLIESSSIEILRIDEEQNAFRFGFASMNEKELETAVGILKSVIEKMNDKQ